MTRPQLAALRRLAVQYAEHGAPIFPVVGKKPHPDYAPHGFKSATTDSTTIKSWFANGSPPTGVAMEPGAIQQAALDIDGRNAGFESLAKLEKQLGGLDDTATSITPGNGEHRFFLLPSDVRIGSRESAFGSEYPGIDVKSTGGYVVLPGSVHPNGGVYRWDASGTKPTPLAPAWLDALQAIERPNNGGERFELPEQIADGKRYKTLFRYACSERDRGLTGSELLEILRVVNNKRCMPPLEERELADLALDVAQRYEPKHDTFKSDDDSSEAWPTLQDLPTTAIVAPSMPIEMVPEPLRPWISDICARMRVPVEMLAVPTMIAAATVVGRNVGIHPKRHDDWLVVPNLWGAIVARPGCLKSPALQEALRPLMRLAHDAKQRFEESRREREPEMNYVESVIAALEANLKNKLRKGNAGDELREEIESKRAEREALAIAEKRYVTNDPTTEKLGELLRDNPRGLLVFRDELIGWLRTLDAAERPNDRGFYLECWNGDGRYNYERIGRGSIHVESACISLLGGIQPGPLQEYISGALSTGRGADGLLQRLQLTIWPDDFPSWENVDRYPDSAAKDRVFEIFKTLDAFEPQAFGAEVADERGIPALRFAPQAQELFDRWRDALENRLRSEEIRDAPAFEAHLAKYRSLMPTLALLHHLIDVAIGVSVDHRVSLRATLLAADWCDFLEGHAAKLYAAEIPSVGHGLATHIERGAVRDGMTLRDILRKGWSRLRTRDDLQKAIAQLEPFGWTRIETRQPTKAGGRPSDVLRLHPHLRESA